MGMGVYGGKDFWKRYVFSLEWKSEGVMDDDSGDSEEDEGEEDWLRQGWRSEAGSLFSSIAAFRTRCNGAVEAFERLSRDELNLCKPDSKLMCTEISIVCTYIGITAAMFKPKEDVPAMSIAALEKKYHCIIEVQDKNQRTDRRYRRALDFSET